MVTTAIEVSDHFISCHWLTSLISRQEMREFDFFDNCRLWKKSTIQFSRLVFQFRSCIVAILVVSHRRMRLLKGFCFCFSFFQYEGNSYFAKAWRTALAENPWDTFYKIPSKGPFLKSPGVVSGPVRPEQNFESCVIHIFFIQEVSSACIFPLSSNQDCVFDHLW